MPKANRYFVEGHYYHLTHRCHDRSFLLKFAKDRAAYREMLRQRLAAYRTPLLGYCITSNHVHLLVTAMDGKRISKFMDCLEGDFAQYYNLRKKRSGAFWGGRYRATAVERREYLWTCLTYIDLNMVRAGVVNHPAEWAWCSYGELIGRRQRYRLINREHLRHALGQDPDAESFKQNYQARIEARINAGDLSRSPVWTESLALGSRGYVDEIVSHVRNRRKLEMEPDERVADNAWVLKEPRSEYA